MEKPNSAKCPNGPEHGERGDDIADMVAAKCDVQFSGVNWKCTLIKSWGPSSGQGEIICTVDGPFCPKCEGKLVENKKKSLLGSRGYTWHCPRCDEDYKPDKEYLYKEKEAVEILGINEFKKQSCK